MFNENNVVLISSVFVLVACAAVMVILFVSAKFIFFMHRVKTQTAGKDSPELPEVKEAEDKQAKPKKDWRKLMPTIKLPKIKNFKRTGDSDLSDSDDLEEETTDVDELQEVNNNSGKSENETQVIYEKGRGYCFNVVGAAPAPDEEEFDDHQDGFELEEGEGPDEQGESDDELELCREIERLTVAVNQIGEHIEKMAEAQERPLEEVEDLIDLEEYDELPGTVDGLQQEVQRLKSKKNRQVDYIEEVRKMQDGGAGSADNKNEEPDFITCVAAAFKKMQKNKFVYKPEKPRGTQDLTYVFIKEFFEALSDLMPIYKQKNVVEELTQRGIIENSEKGYSTVIRITGETGKRMLKVYSKQFDLLTTEIAQDVGA